MLDKLCEEASDLKGITLLYFDKQDSSIEQCCEELKNRIREEEKINRIRLLPSTSLAIGYYRNFIDQLLKCMSAPKRKFYIDGKVIEKEKCLSKVNVVIPPNVWEDWKVWEQMYAEENGLINASVESSSRPMAFMVDGEKWKQENVIEIFDIPQTMRVAFQAVDMTISGIVIFCSKQSRRRRPIL